MCVSYMPDIKLPEDERKIEICRSVSELCVKMYVNNNAFVAVNYYIVKLQ